MAIFYTVLVGTALLVNSSALNSRRISENNRQKVGRLVAKMPDKITLYELVNEKLTYLTKAIEGLQAESNRSAGSCSCIDHVHVGIDTAVSSRNTQELSSIKEGLRREKANRQRLEDAFELLKNRHEYDQARKTKQNADLSKELFKEKIHRQRLEKVVELLHRMYSEENTRNNLITRLRNLETNLSNVMTHLKRGKAALTINPLEEFEETTDRRRNVICPTDFIKVGSGCYYFSGWVKSRQEATDDCKRKDSRVVSVETTTERDLIASHIRSERSGLQFYHIITSGRRNNGDWKWVKDAASSSSISPEVFGKWGPRGDKNCLAFVVHSARYSWQATPCESLYSYYYICEM